MNPDENDSLRDCAVGRYVEVQLDTKARLTQEQKDRKPDMKPKKEYPNVPSTDTIIDV